MGKAVSTLLAVCVLGGLSVGLASARSGGLPRPEIVGKTVLLGKRTQTTGCSRGPNPDGDCSPGAYYAKLTKSVICSPTFTTKTIRYVPQSMKHRVEQEYA